MNDLRNVTTSAQRGAEQLRRVFELVGLDAETYTGRGHTRLKHLEHVISTGQLDANPFRRVP